MPKNRFSSRRTEGFTLIEVLVAAVLLFSAVSIGFLASRSALDVTERVSAHTAIASALPAVVEDVRKGLNDDVREGSGTYGPHIAYAYTGVPLRSQRNLDEIGGDGLPVQYGFYQLTLFDVSLRIEYRRGLATRNQTYRYHELVWRLVEE